MDRWLGKTAVVTGAASGIGEAITRALLRNGVNVAALDIQKEKLTKFKEESEREGFPGRLYPICCDITREDDVNNAFSQIETTLNGVDIMVNNAGVVDYTRIIESDRKAFERLLNINVLAVAVCTNKAVRSMRDRNVEGHIFNVNSLLGHEIPSVFPSETNGYNGWNVYPASKHGAVALTQSVKKELAAIKAPIRVTGISPGLVTTEIANDIKKVKNIFDAVPHLPPEDIANALIYALGTRPEVEIIQLSIQHRDSAF